LKKYTLFSLFFLASCVRPLACPLIWPFGFLPGDNPFRWFLLVAFVAVVVYLIVNAGKKKQADTDETALAILKKRFAKGEITREEYKKIKKEIE